MEMDKSKTPTEIGNSLPAYKYGLKMDYRQDTPDVSRLSTVGILLNAYTAGEPPRHRPTRVFFSSSWRGYWKGLQSRSRTLFDEDLPTGSDDVRVAAIRTMRVSPRVWFTRSSRPTAKSSSSKKYIGPASQQWSVIKDRMLDPMA
jgi:hypothetical protein